MTRKEQNTKLKAFITCLKCEVSGKSCDDNCPTQYEAGNMGEIIENLETISKALEQEPILDKIKAEIEQLPTNYIEIQRPHSTVERDVVELDAVMRIINNYKAESGEK